MGGGGKSALNAAHRHACRLVLFRVFAPSPPVPPFFCNPPPSSPTVRDSTPHTSTHSHTPHASFLPPPPPTPSPWQRLRDFIRDDPQVQEAVAVANDPSRYASLLAPPPAAIFPPAGLPQTIASVRPAATVSRSLPTPFSVAPVLAPPRAAAPPTPPAGIPSAEISWGNTDAGPSPPVASRLAAPYGPGVRGAGLSTSSVRRA